MKKFVARNCIYLLAISISILLTCCLNNTISVTEKIQKQRDNIVNVSNKITDIKTEVLLGKSELYIIDDILIVKEMFPKGEKAIHLFNKNTFKYLTSTGIMGKGPGEISNPGILGIDRKNRIFWVPDNGKWIMYKFPLDSALNNSMFKPTIKKNFNKELFLDGFDFQNDSVALGRGVKVTSNTSFETVTAKMNFNTNFIEKYGYENPEAKGEKSNSYLAMSVKNNAYVKSYLKIDLITICDLEGNLRCNIYGPGWTKEKNVKNNFYNFADFFDRKIIFSYIGVGSKVTKGKIVKADFPSNLIIFDTEGNYLKTIDSGFEFCRFCIDEENKRVIAYFTDRDEPLGYFDISFLDK